MLTADDKAGDIPLRFFTQNTLSLCHLELFFQNLRDTCENIHHFFLLLLQIAGNGVSIKRMKNLFTLSVLGAVALSSCSVMERLTTPGEYVPIYLQEPSPLDPPGMEAVRAEARAKYVKEGMYADGEELEVQQGKAFLFNRNPEYYEGAKGNMVTTEKAKIISCEGAYYFVEIDDGSKGFLRETDMVNPVKLVATTDDTGLLPTAALPPVEEWAPETAADGEQTVMTNQTGRPVLIVSKKSQKTAEFEARRRELEKATEDTDGGLPTPTAELPEPAGGDQ